MIKTPAQKNRELQTLKTLLLTDEHQELLALRFAVQKLTDQVGSDESMQASVRRILSDALEQVSRENPAGISRTLSPLVMNSMRREIKNSADDFIEIMYPLTGRMIAASVKNAIASLSDRINSEIEARFPLRTFILKLRSSLFGLPASDLVLASADAASIERIMILEKASGKLVQLWVADDENTASGQADTSNNAELVTGMLAALNNLAEEAFDASAGNLRTVQLDGRQIALRSSASHLLILEVSGKLNLTDEQEVDQFFADWIAGITTQQNLLLPKSLGDFAHRIGDKRSAPAETNSEPRSKANKLRMTGCVATVIGALLAWPTWSAVQRWSLDADANRISQLIATEPQLAGFPLVVEPIYESESLSVTGLLPYGIDLKPMRLKWLGATEYRQIETNVRFVVTAPLPPPQW